MSNSSFSSVKNLAGRVGLVEASHVVANTLSGSVSGPRVFGGGVQNTIVGYMPNTFRNPGTAGTFVLLDSPNLDAQTTSGANAVQLPYPCRIETVFVDDNQVPGANATSIVINASNAALGASTAIMTSTLIPNGTNPPVFLGPTITGTTAGTGFIGGPGAVSTIASTHVYPVVVSTGNNTSGTGDLRVSFVCTTL